MGGEFYAYWVPGDSDPRIALARIRAEVFAAGAFRGAEEQPATPEAAVIAAAESGTASILDITRISAREEPGAANGLDAAELTNYFGTGQPTREAIEDCDDLAEDIGRGCARYVAAYENGVRVGLVFLGYSYD
jgi:hypothetical protein